MQHIKNLIINEVHHDKKAKLEGEKYSQFIERKIGYDYSYLNELFSSQQGTTIGQFISLQKIERAKELLTYDQLSLSAIALEEVEVTAEAESSDVPLMNVNMNGKRINAEELRRSTSLASFLRRQGFVVTYGGQGRLVVLSRRINPESARSGGPPVRTPVPIVVNGMVREGLDLNIPLSKVQTVFFTDYAVSVQLHRDNFFIANRERYSNFEVPNGYIKPDRFAIPLNFNRSRIQFVFALI